MIRLLLLITALPLLDVQLLITRRGWVEEKPDIVSLVVERYQPPYFGAFSLVRH
jgi:hypothetical protein